MLRILLGQSGSTTGDIVFALQFDPSQLSLHILLPIESHV